jgi:hypothetical protein
MTPIFYVYTIASCLLIVKLYLNQVDASPSHDAETVKPSRKIKLPEPARVIHGTPSEEIGWCPCFPLPPCHMN